MMKFVIWIGAALLIASSLMMMRMRSKRLRQRAGLCPKCGAMLPNVGAPRCPMCGENT